MADKPVTVDARQGQDWIVPRRVMCALFWIGIILMFTGIILLVTSKHKGQLYKSWGAICLGLGFCLLLVCLILCLHAYCVITVADEEAHRPGPSGVTRHTTPGGMRRATLQQPPASPAAARPPRYPLHVAVQQNPDGTLRSVKNLTSNGKNRNRKSSGDEQTTPLLGRLHVPGVEDAARGPNGLASMTSSPSSPSVPSGSDANKMTYDIRSTPQHSVTITPASDAAFPSPLTRVSQDLAREMSAQPSSNSGYGSSPDMRRASASHRSLAPTGIMKSSLQGGSSLEQSRFAAESGFRHSPCRSVSFDSSAPDMYGERVYCADAERASVDDDGACRISAAPSHESRDGSDYVIKWTARDAASRARGFPMSEPEPEVSSCGFSGSTPRVSGVGIRSAGGSASSGSSATLATSSHSGEWPTQPDSVYDSLGSSPTTTPPFTPLAEVLRSSMRPNPASHGNPHHHHHHHHNPFSGDPRHQAPEVIQRLRPSQDPRQGDSQPPGGAALHSGWDLLSAKADIDARHTTVNPPPFPMLKVPLTRQHCGVARPVAIPAARSKEVSRDRRNMDDNGSTYRKTSMTPIYETEYDESRPIGGALDYHGDVCDRGHRKVTSDEDAQPWEPYPRQPPGARSSAVTARVTKLSPDRRRPSKLVIPNGSPPQLSAAFARLHATPPSPHTAVFVAVSNPAGVGPSAHMTSAHAHTHARDHAQGDAQTYPSYVMAAEDAQTDDPHARDPDTGNLAAQMANISLDELDSKMSVYDNVHYNYMRI